MNMKLPLLAASVALLGGCVAPGYDYVQPDYASDGGYYGGAYYADGGYYPDYYDGCCGPVVVGVEYGYPGYYGWGGYPYGYYYHSDYYYDYDGHHHHRDDHDWGDHHGDDRHGGYDDHVDPAVRRWPNAQAWRVPDHPRVPHWNATTPPGGQAPRAQIGAPHFTPHSPSHSNSGASAHEPPPSWTPTKSAQPKAQQF